MVSLTIGRKIIYSGVLTTILGSTLLQLFTKVADDLSRAITVTEYPADRTYEILRSGHTSFDFVIVGCGSAGAVVASRLSENVNWTVLVIEAGQDPYFFSEIPAATFAMQFTDQNYGYLSEVQDNACLSMKDQTCVADKGKALGGSSSINVMLYVPGNKRDYELWAASGNEGWSYEEVLPYFKKSQRMQTDYIEQYGTEDFGADGPLPLRKANSTFNGIVDILLEATESLGYPTLEAFSARNQSGFGKNHQTMEYGRRVNVAKAFLVPNRDRKNLYVMKNTRVDKIVMRDNVATGVMVTLADGSTLEIDADKEVILSAGAVATPQLLMLSGIGPRDHLDEMGIEVVADLPVGKNLQDHLFWIGPMFVYRNDSRASQATQLVDAAAEYVTSHTGYFATVSATNLMGFINVDDPADDYPNIQFVAFVVPMHDKMSAMSLGSGLKCDEEIVEQLLHLATLGETVWLIPTLLHPKSIGRITLRSSSPSDVPRIFHNYLNDSTDVDVLVKSVDYLKLLATTQSFKKHHITFSHLAPAACEVHEADSRDYWECNLRHLATTVWHQSGTAKMGPANDSSAVVDPQLRVHRIHRLRVIDASIMPSITSGNTNAPTIMIAEKGCDMIKAYWS